MIVKYDLLLTKMKSLSVRNFFVSFINLQFLINNCICGECLLHKMLQMLQGKTLPKIQLEA